MLDHPNHTSAIAGAVMNGQQDQKLYVDLTLLSRKTSLGPCCEAGSQLALLIVIGMSGFCGILIDCWRLAG
jgi:hypothetical protein